MSDSGPHTRIADSDRERAMADLAMHYADGRLDHEEYDERLDAIWTARTRADLAVIFSDLPRPQPPAPARQPRAQGGSRRRFPLLAVLALLVVLSVITDLPLWLLVFPLMFFTGRRRGMACPPPHGRADYRRHHSHGW